MVQANPSTAQEPPPRRITAVLVIDGNEEHLALSVTALGRRGFKVSVADTGREGMRLALSQPFHAIVLGHKLRDGPGFDTLKILAERLPEIPRVFVVPEGQEDLAVRSLNAGASGYLVKTARYYELLPAEVEEQLGKMKARARIMDQQRALEDAQARYREFVESSRAPIFVIDPSGHFIAFNDAMSATTGFTREELLRLNLFDILSPESQEGPARRLTDLLHGGPTGTLEFVLGRKDGREVIVEVTPHLVRREGEVVGIEALARDVTDRRRAEKELKDLYGWLRAIYEATNDAFFLADRDLRIVQWNGRALELFRMDAATMAKQTADSLLRSLSERAKNSAQVLDALESYREDPMAVVEGAVDIVTPEPRVFWRLTAPVHSLEGTLLGRLWTFRDITERRRAEERIQYQANLVENVSDAIVSADKEFRITSWNKAAEAIYGWTAEEALGKAAFDFLGTEFLHGSREEAYRELTEKGTWKGELVERRKDCTPVHVLASITQLLDPDGGRVGIVFVNRDITEQKEAEEAVRRRDAILASVGFAADQFLRTADWRSCIQDVIRRLGEAAQVSRVWVVEARRRSDGVPLATMTYEWLADGVTSQMGNPHLRDSSMREGFGRWEELFSRGEPVFGRVAEFPPAEREELGGQDIRSILVFPIIVGDKWWGHIGFDECKNERAWPASEIEALKAAAGVLGTAIERQEALAALRARERQQAAVAELGQLALAGREPDQVIQRAAALVATALDVEFAGVLELQPDAESFLVRAWVGCPPEAIGKAVIPAGKQSQAGFTLSLRSPVIVNDYSTEDRFSAPSFVQEQGIMSGLSVTIQGRDRPFGVLGAHTKRNRKFTEDDVHFLQAAANALAAAIERDRAERELRLSVERFMLVGRATNDIVWDWDVARDHVWRSEALQTVLGYSPEEAVPKDIWWAERLHPEDRERVDRGLFDVLSGEGSFWSDEYRIRRRDGSYAIVFERGFVMRDESGKAIRMIGSVMDITKRRRAELVQDAIYRISAAAGSAKDLDDLYRSIHKIVGQLMPAANFYIALFDPEAETLSFPFFVDQFEAPPPPQRLGRGLTEYVLRTGAALLASPEVFEELVQKGEVELVGPPSIDWVGVPLIANGRTIGVLVTQSYTAGVRYTTEHKEILEFVSTQIAMAIERKRAEEALRESEERFRRIAENAEDLIYRYRLRPTPGFEFVSSVAARMTGYTPDEHYADPELALKITHPEDRPLLESVLRDPSLARKPLQIRWIRKDGAVLWTEQRNVPIFDESGQLVAIEGIARDITEQKRAEEALMESEERYRLLFESNPQPMWVYDLSTLRFLAVNEAAIQHYGYTREEFLSMTIKDIRPPEDVPRLLENVANVRDGLDRAGEWRHLKKDGTQIDVEITSHTVEFAGRKAELVLANDITERKRAREELRRSERKFRTLFEAAAEAILLVDVRANITDINPAGEAVVGGRRDAVIGRNLQDFLLKEDLERGQQYLRSVLREEPTEEPFEIPIRTIDGRNRFVEVRSRAVLGEGHEPYVEMAIRDVTDEKEMQRRLLQSERLASVGKLSTYVAHEINTPLTNISLLTASLARRIENRELLEKLEKINVQRRMATNIITDLLKFTKHRDISASRIDLRGIVQEALEQVETYRRPDVKLVLELGKDPVEMSVDPVQMQEVFVNLAKNAYEATSKGSVHIRFETRGNHIAVVVSDTGSGMTPEARSHLFEPFFTTKKFGEGTGLGLPLCQSIVHAHGGQIEVETSPGKGSTFTVLLPREGVH